MISGFCFHYPELKTGAWASQVGVEVEGGKDPIKCKKRMLTRHTALHRPETPQPLHRRIN